MPKQNSYMNYEESWEDNKEIHVLAGTNRIDASRSSKKTICLSVSTDLPQQEKECDREIRKCDLVWRIFEMLNPWLVYWSSVVLPL